jgi:hypothetical protein
MALVTCYVNIYVLPVSDSLTFHDGGIYEYDLLFQNPKEYLVNLFHNSYENGYGGLLDAKHSYWNDTKGNFLMKLLSVFDLFSGKNFIINTLIFNFLVFFGPVALFRVLKDIYPKAVTGLIICIFLLPSPLFFTSMIHRDGFIFLSVCMIIYIAYFSMKNKRLSGKHALCGLLFMALIFVLRNYVLLALIPALLAWKIARDKPKYSFYTFLIIYSASAFLFFISPAISQKTDLPKYVVERQEAFLELGATGSSTIDMRPLENNLSSFIRNMPQALNHSLMRPFVTETKSYFYMPFLIENMALIVCIFLLVFFRKKVAPDPLIWLFVFFCLSNFLLIGYTVPIIGALVRYKSVWMIFLSLSLLVIIDWKKVALFFYIKNNKIL